MAISTWNRNLKHSLNFMPQTPAITPRPQQLTSAAGFFTLSKTTPLVSQSAAATGALSWFADALYQQSGVKLETSTFDAPNAITLREDAALAPEIYALSIAPDGIEICASQASGFLYGLVTLLQTIPFEAPSAPATWLLGALRIEDAPRFGWRGVMLDSAPFSTGLVDRKVPGRARPPQTECFVLAFGRRSGLTHRILTLSATDQRERVARSRASVTKSAPHQTPSMANRTAVFIRRTNCAKSWITPLRAALPSCRKSKRKSKRRGRTAIVVCAPFRRLSQRARASSHRPGRNSRRRSGARRDRNELAQRSGRH